MNLKITLTDIQMNFLKNKEKTFTKSLKKTKPKKGNIKKNKKSGKNSIMKT